MTDVASGLPPDALHVTNGEATDLPGTGLARHVLCWRDVLHDTPASFAEFDRGLEAHRHGDYVLWFEADLYDQLQVVEILSRLRGLDVPAGRVALICIGEHPGIARFGGLGELTAAQLRALPSTGACARLTAAALDLAERAWAAFRSPTPYGLADIAADRSPELRFLGEAYDRLGREYPSTRDGLSLTERRLLAAVAGGAPDAGSAFVRAARRETRPFLGDTWGFATIERLAGAPDPLLAVGDDDRVRCDTPVRVTCTGARVLAGRTDHVELNGVDRWVGGVHLHGRQVPWRWDEGTEAVIEAGA